ncbi:hypothetical protein [Amycolatopsis sp. NPDC004079]|uniref:hypothetical protein n=1 Tax=Amycolatopsis sp. NPDC004079 TaxID=3154549 RepID=UPI0033A9751C
MIADDRVALLDLENLGMVKLRPRTLRTRLESLLAACGDIDHAVASYAVAAGEAHDPAASVLAELRIAPLRVPPGPDAAELALLAHARHVHAEGGRIFVVASADGRFAELAALGRVELLVWEGQPVATKLAGVAHSIRRLRRPTGAPLADPAELVRSGPEPEPPEPAWPRPQSDRPGLARHLLVAVATGAGIALGNRIAETLLPGRTHRPR